MCVSPKQLRGLTFSDDGSFLYGKTIATESQGNSFHERINLRPSAQLLHNGMERAPPGQIDLEMSDVSNHSVPGLTQSLLMTTSAVMMQEANTIRVSADMDGRVQLTSFEHDESSAAILRNSMDQNGKCVSEVLGRLPKSLSNNVATSIQLQQESAHTPVSIHLNRASQMYYTSSDLHSRFVPLNLTREVGSITSHSGTAGSFKRSIEENGWKHLLDSQPTDDGQDA